MSGSHLSKEFFDLVKSIGESRSKQEEDKIIANEVGILKAKMSAKDVPSKKMKEYIIRMIYVEMLGHDASFGHIHAVKMTHNRSLIEKRVGYLGVSLTLHKDHSFMLLLINTLQNDLKSENYLEVCMSLIVCCKLINLETVPALLPLIVRLLEHKEGNVKKKAVMALHRFHQLDPSTISTLGAPIRKALCDSNISVMGASLNLFHELVMHRPSNYKDLVPDFVSILKQVIEHRLPRDYDYHRMPAPWIQLKLLQILAVLGAADKQAAEGMYEILHEVMKRADIGTNVGYAIVYECVRTVTSIYPDSSLIDDAARAISKFITSENHNLKYLGITSLAGIVGIDSKYAVEHQLIVVNCLEDSDETLKRKTLDLLYSMTNPANVVVIVDKLIQSLTSSNDNYLRIDLVSRITQLAEKYAPNNQWYIQIMNHVFEMGAELIRPEMAHSVMRLIAESSPDSGAASDDIREYAVDTYVQLLQSKRTSYPDILIQVIAWVLGEFGFLSQQFSKVEILNELVSLLEKQVDKPEITKAWILGAITKLTAHIQRTGPVPPSVIEQISRYQSSLFVDLQQRAHEFLELVKKPQTLTAIFPPNSFIAQDTVIDPTLSFLDAYVQTALANGAKPYVARTLSSAPVLEHHENKLKFQPYTAPAPEIQAAPAAPQPNLYDTYNPHASGFGSAPVAVPPPEDGLKLQGVQKRWGPTGYNDPSQQQASTPPQPAPVPQAQPVQQQPQPTIAQLPPQPVEEKKPPPPQKPRELTAQEKLASSLFAGIGGTSTVAATASTSYARRPVATASTSAAPTPAAQPAAAPVDILSGFVDAIPVATPVAAAPVAKPADPLDLLFGNSAPVQNTPPKPAQSNSNDLFDIIGTSIPQAAPVSNSFAGLAISPQTSSPIAQAAPANDPFSALIGNSPSPAYSPPASNSLDGLLSSAPVVERLGAANMAPHMALQLSSLEKIGGGVDATLLNDSRVHVSSFRALAPDSTLLVLFVTNRTGVPLQNVAVTLTIPSHFTVNFSGDPQPSVRSGQTPNQHILFFPAVAAKQTITQLVSLQVKELVVVNQPLPFGIHGNLHFAGLPTALPFATTVELTELIRSSPMKTEQYGSLWKLYGDEMKASVRPSSCTSCPDLMNRLSAAHFHPVQTIGTENILAAKLVGDVNHAFLVLVHAKVSTHVDLIVRSKNKELSSAISKHLSVVLK